MENKYYKSFKTIILLILFFFVALTVSCTKPPLDITVEQFEITKPLSKGLLVKAGNHLFTYVKLDTFKYFNGTVKLHYNDSIISKHKVSDSNSKHWLLILKGESNNIPDKSIVFIEQL